MLFLDNPTTKKFLIGVWVGLSFSIAVILSTLGLMDGFDHALRQGLKKSAGDVVMNSRSGFFNYDLNLAERLEQAGIKKIAQLVQTESFLIYNDESRGILVKAIDHSYGEIVGLALNLAPGKVAIGSEIAKINNIHVGDDIVLAFGKGNQEIKNMPVLRRFMVDQIVNHGIYQKDSRLIYANLEEIQEILSLNKRVNMLSFNITNNANITNQDLDIIENKLVDLRIKFEPEYFFKPYWREFSSLIEAVKAEKFLISLILQLIVVISIFNVLAFIIFLNEKKSKELFLFKALGLSKKAMSDLWFKLVLLIWLGSCALSAVMVAIFKWLLLKVSFFELPAEVYHMPRIELFLTWKDYIFVFFLALVWILIITYYLLKKLREKSLLEGLRQEFV